MPGQTPSTQSGFLCLLPSSLLNILPWQDSKVSSSELSCNKPEPETPQLVALPLECPGRALGLGHSLHWLLLGLLSHPGDPGELSPGQDGAQPAQALQGGSELSCPVRCPGSLSTAHGDGHSSLGSNLEMTQNSA